MNRPQQPITAVKPVRRRASLLRRIMRSFITIKGSPEQIALGAAIGMFVAFSPTIGLQIIAALFIATCVNASRPATLIPIWITNPVTIAPIYTFTYWLGAFFWPGADAPMSQIYDTLKGLVKALSRHGTFDIIEQFRTVMGVGVELFMPMLIGGFIVGAVCGVMTYFATLWLLRGYHEARTARKARRRASWLMPGPGRDRPVPAEGDQPTGVPEPQPAVESQAVPIGDTTCADEDVTARPKPAGSETVGVKSSVTSESAV